MLPAYCVVIGKYVSSMPEQGQWYHLDLSIDCDGTPYQAAVDVNEQGGSFQYQVLNNLDTSLFTTISNMSDGQHILASNSTSGAIDYKRSPIFAKPEGCLTLFFGFIGAVVGSNLGPWIQVTGKEAANALQGLMDNSTRVFAFGAPYTSGNGVHDVHCNQGDPPGPHQADDGIWQDGCVFALQKDGSLSVYLGMFSTQTLNTNSNGLPA